jgi:NADH-quinone oxidoreductase subunit E
MSATAEPAVDLAAVDRILAAHPRERRALIMILQDLQRELRYLPRAALEHVAEALHVPRAQVFQLATFYRAFSLTPRGKHICTVCLGTACHVRGAPKLVEHIERKSGIKASGTTPDLLLTLETVNCVGACALGPLVVLDGEYHGNMTLSGVDKLLKGLKQ